MNRHSWISVASLLAASVVGGTARADEAKAPDPANPTDRHGSVFVDPLGFLLFGPRVGVEAGGGRVSGALYGRWFNVGVLSHSLFLNAGDSFAFSYGVGARGRYYLSDGFEKVHLGLAVEYLHSRIENSAALIATESGYFVPQVEAGYRLPIGSFYADASGALGYAFQLSGRVKNLPGGSAAVDYVAEDKSSFYGSASLDLGVTF